MSPAIRLCRVRVDLRCMALDLERLRDQLPVVCADPQAADLAASLNACADHIHAFLETERIAA